MMRLFLLIFAFVSFCAAPAMANQPHAPGVVLVTYKRDATPDQIADVEIRHALVLKRRLPAFRIFHYDSSSNPIPPVELAVILAAEEAVSAASPDYGVRPQQVDPRVGEQWHLRNTGQTLLGTQGKAGVDINYFPGAAIYQPKQGIVVSVVDSGITLLHPDLLGSLSVKSSDPINGVDDDGNGLVDDAVGYNWFDPQNSSLPLDTFGHGTQVASVIAATADNGKGVRGIAPTAKITSHRVFSSLGKMGAPKYANISDVIFAVAVSVADGAKIINLSLGGPSFSAVDRQFYAELADEDVLVVCAAGNGGSDGVSDDNDAAPNYPSGYDSSAIISVAAIDQLGELAGFSNFGANSVDIAAPGVNILMADVTRRPVHQPDFASATGGWTPYRFTATDLSYSRWGYYGGYLRDRIDGSSAYRANTDTFLLSPEIDLSDSTGTVLDFTAGTVLADDQAWVEASEDGFNWETVKVLSRYGYGRYQADLADYDWGKVKIRLRLRSNSYSQGAGVIIDGLKLTSVDVLDEENPSYTFSNGTSFAAPIVSGVAAMVWMHRPELTAAQVKSIILDSARKFPALNGKVATGGIVDAEAALKLADIRTGNVLPVVIDQPDGGTYLQGASMTLSVFATSGLPATYQWRKDGVNISGATLSTYSINSLQVGDSGRYDVVVTSRAGAVVSASAQITVAARPPAIDSQPTRPALVMIAGENGYTMSVSATGTAPFAYQWLKAGVAIPGATSSSFTLNNLKTTDAGVYTVRVSNAAGSVTSQPVTVSVSVRPAFKTDLPATATVLTGVKRTLAVVATGSPLPTYQWRKDGVDIPNARLASYVVPATTVPTTATYSVVIANAAGSLESALCQLSSVSLVSVPPSGQPQARNVVAGQSASFTVTPSGTGPFTYQWLKNGVVIAGATSQTYTIPSVSAADAAAKYSVRVSNGAGTATSLAATLSVLGFRTDLPAVATVLTGATRTLAVVATGAPLPTYQWRKDGVDIPNARGVSYVVPATSVPTTATYSVVITNAAGSLESTPCQLSSVSLVSVPTSGQPQARNLKVGDSASFTVTPAGTGPFTYQWLKNGIIIAGATSQTYTIPVVTASDAAKYSVRVSNGAGTATSLAATLSVLGFKTDLPASATVLTGATRTLSVVATGSPLPTYQWRKDGVDIPNARLASYVVPATTVPTTATYSVVIANAAGSLESALCQLSSVSLVSVPPSGQPQARNVVAGQSASFTVTPSGTGPFTYQWLKNGVVIAGATSQTYTIPSVSAADAAAKYSVRVSNGAGTATSLAATLSVLGFRTDLPAVATVLTGATRTLAVVATGAPLPTYQWRKDGVDIPNARGVSYVVPATSVPTTATYSVVITNAAGSLESTPCQLSSVSLVSVPTSGQPQARNLKVGDSASFTVTPAGTGPFTYQWLKNGIIIAGATSQTYTIPVVTASDAAKYSVRVSNGAGTATSAAAILSVLGFKTDLPATATVLTGVKRTLSVVATGSPLPTYQWRKDGVDIPNARLASYVVPATTVPTTATYSVVIANAAGSLESALCQLSSVSLVSVPPSGQPQARNVVAGQSASFTVTPSGTGPFTYQWLKNGVVIAGATSQTYSIAFVSALEAATYSVRVSNVGGTVTSLGAILKVITPFNITGQPNAAVGTMVLAAGTSKALTVKVAGAGPFTYQWRKDGQPIAGATLASYLVQAGSVVGSAVYDVVITGPVSATSSSAVRVDTVLPPSFLQQPASVARALGQPATFSVSMGGTGPFTYQWLKNGIAIAGATGVAYTVESVIATSAGNYSVKVTGPGGSATSLPGTLSLQAAPAVSAQPANQYKAAGQSVTFSVAATGTGPLSYQWSKDGNPIPGANSATYSLASITSSDQGDYAVSISNAVGSVVSSAATLTIVTAPAILSQPSAVISVPAAGTRMHRSKWVSFNSGSDGWTVVPWNGRWDEFPSAGWIWNDQIAEAGVEYSSLECAEGGGSTLSPQISLAGLTSPEVRLRASAGPAPFLIECSRDDTNWTVLHASTGNMPDDAPLVLSLAAFAGNTVRFRISSAGSALVDDVEIWGHGTAKEPVEMTVEAVGGGLTYQWYKNGIAIAGAKARTLMIPDVYASGAADSYSVTITNAAGVAASTNAKVGVAPSIKSQPISLNRTQGQSAVFSVTASGTGPLTYQWTKAGVPIVGATGSSYSIASVSASSAGSYAVTVTGFVGQVTSQDVTLAVITPPIITSNPSSTSVQGPYFSSTTLRNYTFDYGAEGWTYGSNLGDSSPYDWAWDSATGALTDRSVGTTYSNGTDTFVQSPWISTLGVWTPALGFYLYHDLYSDFSDRLEVQASSDGVFWNTLRSIYGLGSQVYTVSLADYQLSGLYLRYRLKTDFFGTDYGVEVRSTAVTGSILISGGTASFSVGVLSSAGCSFQWYKNGTAISGANSSTFQIPSVISSDAGLYRVIVTNAAGSVSSAEASLSVL